MAPPAAITPTAESVLASLTQQRILDIGRKLGVGLRGGREAKRRLAARLGALMQHRLPAVLGNQMSL